MKVWQLIVAGVTVHVVLFYSIFDIYFTSPLVHGMTPVLSPTPTPSQRLILFVTDGLRADKFYEQDEQDKSRTPYMREIIESEGVWGISHTRVPTESRPGHVALIAGFYEDVSAVAKGWKENPVEFDSVFNESYHTWSWGSPDILPMFAKGASGDHVTVNCYPSDLEDFAGSDMTLLDTWVFDQVTSFFYSASRNLTLKKELHKSKIVFFLHLLGIDTHGHSHKPHSREYLNNIRLVDKGIKEVVTLIEDFYGHDGATSYVVTADHGMTDWGSHGAGHAHETLTPFVAWGSGIRKPILSKGCGVKTDTFCSDWKLQTVKRTDVEQADIAPLMSYLVGIPFPLNSVGTLPVDVLSASDADKASALLANAENILAQFEVKMKQIKDRTIAATFRPFQELIEAEKLQSLRHIRNLIHNGQFLDSIHESNVLIQKALRGLQYYQTYDRFFLGVSIVLAFLGWMFYILYLVLLEHTPTGQAYTSSLIRSRQSSVGFYLFCGIGVCVTILLYAQSLPLMCYVYCILPVVLWYKSSQGFGLLFQAIQSAAENKSLAGLALSVLFCLAGLEIVIQSFYHRELLSLGLLAMSVWPLFIYRSQMSIKNHMITYAGWSLTCLLVAVFPLLPVVGGKTRYGLVLTSGILATVGGAFIFKRVSKYYCGLSKYLLVFQIFLVGLGVIIVKTTSDSIEQKFGLPFICQVCSWAVLGFSTFLPLFSPTSLEGRLFSLTLSFIAPYLLFSITYEGYFFLSLLALLYFWLRMENSISEQSDQHFWDVDFRHGGLVKDNISSAKFSRYLELSDLRRAFFFIFFNLTAFFGTGNIASINSFDPSSVYCFLTVFNPFLMGTLMMLKVVIPFLEVTCVFRAVHVLTRTPLRSLFLIVLIMSDFMGLHFFFLVRDHGSWLEIGTTISHYVIVMLMILFLLVFTGASHALTCWRLSISSHKTRAFY